MKAGSMDQFVGEFVDLSLIGNPRPFSGVLKTHGAGDFILNDRVVIDPAAVAHIMPIDRSDDYDHRKFDERFNRKDPKDWTGMGW